MLSNWVKLHHVDLVLLVEGGQTASFIGADGQTAVMTAIHEARGNTGVLSLRDNHPQEAALMSGMGKPAPRAGVSRNAYYAHSARPGLTLESDADHVDYEHLNSPVRAWILAPGLDHLNSKAAPPTGDANLNANMTLVSSSPTSIPVPSVAMQDIGSSSPAPLFPAPLQRQDSKSSSSAPLGSSFGGAPAPLFPSPLQRQDSKSSSSAAPLGSMNFGGAPPLVRAPTPPQPLSIAVPNPNSGAPVKRSAAAMLAEPRTSSRRQRFTLPQEVVSAVQGRVNFLGYRRPKTFKLDALTLYLWHAPLGREGAACDSTMLGLSGMASGGADAKYHNYVFKMHIGNLGTKAVLLGDLNIDATAVSAIYGEAAAASSADGWCHVVRGSGVTVRDVVVLLHDVGTMGAHAPVIFTLDF